MAALIVCMAACDHKAPPAAQATPADSDDASAGPTIAVATPTPPARTQEVVFGDGFHKEEASPAATLRWVQQNAALRVVVPTEGRYRLTFRPFTVFSTVENTIDANVNGLPAGSFSTRLFDPANPVPTTLEVPLRAGDNDVHLHSREPEKRLGESDDRMAAFGLVVPVGVERVP